MNFFTRWFGGGGKSTAQVPSRCRSDELDGATALLQERTLGAFEGPANDLLRPSTSFGAEGGVQAVCPSTCDAHRQPGVSTTFIPLDQITAPSA
jgi:hypothetical protein